MKHTLRTPWLLLPVIATLGVGAARHEQAVSDRETYNQGTIKLSEKDFSTAEMLLFSVVSANDEQLQPTALYNLGLARFELGAEALAKGPDANTVRQRAASASSGADAALQEGLTAMQRGEQQGLIRAYLRGRGTRRQVKEAMKAMQEALNVQGNVLSRWHRASGDFHSTAELRPDDADAAHNAEVVDRHIARLVDSIRQMQSMMQCLGDKREGLQQMLEGLEGLIPDDMGSPGPGEDGEDWPEGPEPGMEEAKGREGDERPISPEDAQRLLESFQLDRGRALPMGFEENAKPEDLKRGKNW